MFPGDLGPASSCITTGRARSLNPPGAARPRPGSKGSGAPRFENAAVERRQASRSLEPDTCSSYGARDEDIRASRRSAPSLLGGANRKARPKTPAENRSRDCKDVRAKDLAV